jgi:hypothetical protein
MGWIPAAQKSPMQNPHYFVKVEKGTPMISVDFKGSLLGTARANARPHMDLVLKKRIPNEAPHIRQIPVIGATGIG